MAKKSLPSIQIPSAKNEDQPATRKMLSLVKDELKSDIRSLEQKMEAGFKEVRGDIVQIKGDIVEIKSSIDEMKASGFRTQVLLEEQHANNRIVLEGLQALWQRQDRIEQDRR